MAGPKAAIGAECTRTRLLTGRCRVHASLLLSTVPLPELLALEVEQEALPKVVAEGAEEEVGTGRAGLARKVRRLSSLPR